MKLGVCTSPENVFMAAAAGFDYVECSLNALAAMEEDAYLELLHSAPDFPIPISKCNCLFPGDIPVVGPNVSQQQICAYLNHAFSRASRLGIKLAVFGSGKSRSYPEDASFGNPMQQLANCLKLMAEYADQYDIDIAIEPLRLQECNLVNLVFEATILAIAVNHPRIGVLGDTFHMLSVHEPWENLANARHKRYHMHISHTLPDLSGRIYPRRGDGEDYTTVIDTLKSMRYHGDVSVEAGTKDFSTDSIEAVLCLKKLLA